MPLARLERGGDADGELGPATALDELDQRVNVRALIARERGRQLGGEAGLGELAAPPGRDCGALDSIWPEAGPHVSLGVAPYAGLTGVPGAGTKPVSPLTNLTTRLRR